MRGAAVFAAASPFKTVVEHVTQRAVAVAEAALATEELPNETQRLLEDGSMVKEEITDETRLRALTDLSAFSKTTSEARIGNKFDAGEYSPHTAKIS